ncbi:MAG: thioredoxin [Halobacteriales archaeon]|nr:thioredoxin [Halobacteriales archaeon]
MEDEELAAIRARKLAELQRLALAPAKPVEVTEASLPGFVAQHALAVVDCWAAWCGPCRLMEPVLDALASELRGQVAFGKLNVDEQPGAAQSFDVASIPTLLVFRRGRLDDRIVGAAPASVIRQRLGV